MTLPAACRRLFIIFGLSISLASCAQAPEPPAEDEAVSQAEPAMAAGEASAGRPFVVEGGAAERLYVRRYWRYEEETAAALLALATLDCPPSIRAWYAVTKSLIRCLSASGISTPPRAPDNAP